MTITDDQPGLRAARPHGPRHAPQAHPCGRPVAVPLEEDDRAARLRQLDPGHELLLLIGLGAYIRRPAG